MEQTKLMNMLGIKYPIIQAGMAGSVTTAELVAAVSEAGGLGTLGAGYMKPEVIRSTIAKIRELTAKPFAVNLLIARRRLIDDQMIQNGKRMIRPMEEQLGLQEHRTAIPEEDYHEKLAVLIEEKVPIVSFAFDIPDVQEIQELKKHGTIIIGTATNVREAKVLANIGVDAIVGQGSEAGGHRGTFLGTEPHSLIGTMALIPQLIAAVPTIPIIAAGGIMDGRGLIAAVALGAEGVQMGTAFLTCKESGAHPVHKQAVLHSNDQSTVVTRVFSGRYARGIENAFIKQMKGSEQDLPPYPIQNSLTSSLRSAAATQGNADYMALWAGQASSLARELTAADLVEKTMEQAKKRVAELHQFRL
ncbi:NAD(P)H-dependent flavin oxidoreductase [Ectobacillus polymachus]|uniref:NAD(P)H-dependent flavin oxidoreductase n=1 Tax=Ectobacillus polymachus TaxID=1508806 RepID=UPI003A843324